MSPHHFRSPAPAGSPRRNGRLSRDAIISAAAESFYAHGYAETTLSTVARHLNVTDKAIYYYFESKDELYLVTVNRCMDWVASVVESIDRSEATGLDKIKTFARAVVRQARQREPHLKTLPEHLEDTELGRRFRALQKAQDETLIRWVEEGIADGSIGPDNPTVLWIWNQGALIWLDAWAQENCSNYTPERMEAAAVAMLDRCLAARKPDRQNGG